MWGYTNIQEDAEVWTYLVELYANGSVDNHTLLEATEWFWTEVPALAVLAWAHEER